MKSVNFQISASCLPMRQRLPRVMVMKALALLGIVLCSTLFVGCSSTSDAVASPYSRRYPVKQARVATPQNGEDGVRMYKGNGVRDSRIAKADVAHPADKVVPRKESAQSEQLNPAEVGAGTLSMQDYNRYAYRKNNSSESGVPVTKAGEKSEESVKR